MDEQETRLKRSLNSHSLVEDQMVLIDFDQTDNMAPKTSQTEPNLPSALIRHTLRGATPSLTLPHPTLQPLVSINAKRSSLAVQQTNAMQRLGISRQPSSSAASATEFMTARESPEDSLAATPAPQTPVASSSWLYSSLFGNAQTPSPPLRRASDVLSNALASSTTSASSQSRSSVPSPIFSATSTIEETACTTPSTSSQPLFADQTIKPSRSAKKSWHALSLSTSSIPSVTRSTESRPRMSNHHRRDSSSLLKPLERQDAVQADFHHAIGDIRRQNSIGRRVSEGALSARERLLGLVVSNG